MPKPNSTMQENLMLYMEGEEEDEDIVFKPTIAEKPIDVSLGLSTAYVAHGPDGSVSKGELGNYTDTYTSPVQSSSPQHALDDRTQSVPSSANVVPEHLQPINSSVPNWHTNQQDYFFSEMKNLSVVDNGNVTNTKLGESLNASTLPPMVSHSFPQNTSLTAGGMFTDQRKAPEAVVPSKFYAMYSGPNGESLTMKPSAALAANLRKSPVSRPVRHPGPPPGFSLPPKAVNESVVDAGLKNEIPQLDDYRWLDGYQLSSSTNTMVPSNFINSTSHGYPHMINNINSVSGASSFPFPGQQVPGLPVQVETEKTWQDYQLLEHLKLYQQNQHQQANQDSVPLVEKYPGQPLWSGRFFV